ncbi:MAG: hypothetical protein K5866_03685 [Treponema sp.]|nr:hypothetical protein [Treponema sp.]
MKKNLLAILCILGISASLSALDFSLKLTPTLMLPSHEYLDKEYGATVQADINLFNLISLGLDASFLTVTPEGLSSNINFISIGGGLGAFYTPIARLYLGAGIAGGLYNLQSEIDSTEYGFWDLYARAYGELGFRINPSLTVYGNGGYAYYLVKDSDPLNKGPFAGLGIKINFTLGEKSSGGLTATLEQDSVIYPLFQQVYGQSPIGTIHITNAESAEVRNVKVYFRAGKYTSSAKESASISILQKLKTSSASLYADFSSELLKFNEDGKLSGEIVMEYEMLGKKKVAVQNVTLSVSNRNAFIWGSNESLAAFISSNTPEILEYAKYVSGIARNNLYTGMNRNVQFAAALMESLRAIGISYSDDKITPYKTYHLSNQVDSIQYPLQTMNYLGGDYDDLGILLASCLESVGVETAFMPVADDFIVFVSANLKAKNVANHFADLDGLIYDEGDPSSNVFFPLSMANFDKGFAKSRQAGEEVVKACKLNTSASYDFVTTHDAWAIYPSAVYTGSGVSFEKPSQAQVEKLTADAVKDYVATDLEPVIEIAKKSGDANKIGMAYVRSGKYSDAKTEFNKAIAAGSVSAMNNLANLLLMEKDYDGATAMFKKVLQKEPENKIALKGLESTKEKLEE